MSKKNSFNDLMQKADKIKLKKQENTESMIPQRYLINGYESLSNLSAFSYLINKCKEMLINNKSFSKFNSNHYKSEIIDALIKYSKTEETAFNIRKKHFILEFNQQKISNFLIIKLGNINSCIDNTDYTAYLVTTIGEGPELLITIPKNEVEQAKAIEDKLKKHNMLQTFESYTENLNQVYNFAVEYISYANAKKEENLRQYIPNDYTISENEAYQQYLNKKAMPEEIDESKEKHKKEEDIPEKETVLNTDSSVEVRFSTIELPNFNYEIDVYSELNKLFDISDTKTMLILLGFFMANAAPQLSENKYHHSINLIANKNTENAKKIVDLLYRIVFKKEKHSAVLYDPNKKIKTYLKDSLNSLTTILAVSDVNKTDRINFSSALGKYYEKNPNRLKEALLILSEKEFPCHYIYNLTLKTPEEGIEKNIVALKSSTALNKTIEAFLKNIKYTYNDRTIPTFDFESLEENNAELIKSDICEKENYLSINTALTNEETIVFAPIIYFLEEYFNFLLQSKGITEEQYISLSKKLKELYSSDFIEENDSMSEKNSQPTPEEVSETLLQCIFEAYKTDKFGNDHSNDNAYLYTGSKEHNELLCFRHTQESPMKYIIDFLEGIGMSEEISEIKDSALKEDTGERIKTLWKDSGISHSKNGLLYTTRQGKVIAIICDKLKGLFES